MYVHISNLAKKQTLINISVSHSPYVLASQILLHPQSNNKKLQFIIPTNQPTNQQI